MKKFLLSALVALVLATPAAVAEKDVETVRIDVQFEQTLLESEAGIATLMGMIKTKAREACTSERVYPYGAFLDEACVEEMLVKAEAQISGKRADARQEAPTIVLSSLDAQ